MVSALREWMAELGERAQVAVSNIGKWKTAAQMMALIVLLAYPPAFNAWVLSGYALLIASLVSRSKLSSKMPLSAAFLFRPGGRVVMQRIANP